MKPRIWNLMMLMLGLAALLADNGVCSERRTGNARRRGSAGPWSGP